MGSGRSSAKALDASSPDRLTLAVSHEALGVAATAVLMLGRSPLSTRLWSLHLDAFT